MRRWHWIASLALGLAALVQPAGATGGPGQTPVKLVLTPETDTQVKITNAVRFPAVEASGWYNSGAETSLYGNDAAYGTAAAYTYITQYKVGAEWVAGLSGTFVIPVSSALQTVNIPVTGDGDEAAGTVIVRDHNGHALDSVAISYLDGYWRGLGSTSGGQVTSTKLKPGVRVRAERGGTVAEQVMGDAGLVFYTTEMTATAANSDAGNLSGVAISYLSGYYRGIGSTGTNGAKSVELFPTAALKWRAEYGGSVQEKTEAIPGNCAVQGNTGLVSFASTKVTITVLKSNGITPLSGVAISYLAGYWRGIGSTGTDGTKSCELFGSDTRTFRAEYGGTVAERDVAVGTVPDATFYTTSVSVSAVDSNAKAINGVSMSYLSGYYRGLGSTTGNGPVVANLFGGTYGFRAEYGGTVGTKSGELINGATTAEAPNVDDSVVFQLTRCSLWYNAAGKSVSYVAGYERGISNPAEFWLFDGTYTFRFGHSGAPKAETSVTITGPVYQASIAIIKVLDSSGNRVCPVSPSYLKNNAWQSVTPDAGHLATFVLPSSTPLGSLYFRAGYNGGINEKWQNIAAAPSASAGSIVTFQCKKVTFKTLSAGGAEVVGTASYLVNNAWATFGSGQTKTTMELLPASYYFGTTYNGGRNEKWQNVGTDPVVVFQARSVTFKVLGADGEPREGTASYLVNNAWVTFGAGKTTTTMELLPASYYFGTTYNGGRNEKWQNVGTDPVVVFQAKNVTVRLLSGGVESAATARYLVNNAWATFGSGETTTTMELLPANYYFRVAYAGGSQEKWQNVASAQDVTFSKP